MRVPKAKTILLLVLLSIVAGKAAAAQPSFSTRAIWVDPGSFATAHATDEMIARCQRAGLNLIIPNVMCYQTISFQSAHFHGKVAATDQFDPLAYLIAKAHAAGMKVQPWCCVYYEGVTKSTGKLLHPQWSTISIAGKRFDQNFISPAHPEVNPYLLAVMKDLLAYEIDGIHLDYIRYPGGAFDYSEAARKAFQAAKGFDPLDFLDHPERIVSPELEKYPVRVLQPRIHAEKVWETTAIERTLDQAGLGYAFLSESPDNITKLGAPGLLIVSSYYDAPPKLISALEQFVGRGGTIVWTDVPTKALASSAALRELLGVESGTWKGATKVALQPVQRDSLGALLTRKPFRIDSAYAVKIAGAKVIANYLDGSPAIVVNSIGQGRVITLAFHLMKSTAPEVAAIAKQIVGWCETQAGVTDPNPLVAKRAEWCTWRGDRVTALVRELSVAAKQKDPRLVISSSGGPSPFEFFACYRDARRWLAEGINDAVFPMNYTPDPEVLAEMLELQTASAPPGAFTNIFPGLQLYVTRTVNGKKETRPQDASVVARQLEVVQEHGYRGFCLFAYNHLTEEIIAVTKKFSQPGQVSLAPQ